MYTPGLIGGLEKRETAMASGQARRRVMLVYDNAARLQVLEQMVAAEGLPVVGRFDPLANLAVAVAQLQPDMVLISVDMPSREMLERLARLQRDQPRPMMLFAAQSDADTTRRAVQTGISAYIVDGLHAARLSTQLEVAVTRFEWQQNLREELDEARIRLADHRDIGKAKGLIMKRRELDEAEAYRLLQKMAMDRKQRIGDFSRMLLGAANAL
ncbi:ANTAR domain-containing response regulator [Nevskia ramosa]|uniref:ANTAR domain-containing response regulator n=1 Tax=Nevskia ramosa TaxID=64002 RepID=UPI00146C3192|nr:ANTAR domain-containing protein [Nevskia ramosa]